MRPSSLTLSNTGHRLWVHGLLALFMLLAQQGGWRHGLLHAAHGSGSAAIAQALPDDLDDASRADGLKRADQGPASCGDCLAYAAAADALAWAQPVLAPVETVQADVPLAGHSSRVAEVHAGYRSRAPPRG